MSRQLVQPAADGDVVTGPVYLHSVVFTGADTANTLELRDGSGGAVRLTLKAAAGASVAWRSGHPDGVLFSTSINYAHAGAGAVAALEYS